MGQSTPFPLTMLSDFTNHAQTLGFTAMNQELKCPYQTCMGVSLEHCSFFLSFFFFFLSCTAGASSIIVDIGNKLLSSGRAIVSIDKSSF